MKLLHQELFGVFFFPPKTIHDPMFSQGFLENQGLSTKTIMKMKLLI
jgi:hypothetical protein